MECIGGCCKVHRGVLSKEFSGAAIPYSAVFQGLQSNTEFSIKVVAFNAAGASTESDSLQVYTRPRAPGDLHLANGEASRSSSGIYLKWPLVAGVPRYQVECSLGTVAEFDNPPVQGNLFENLPENTPCTFVVRSFDPAKGGLSLSQSPPLSTLTRPPRPGRTSVEIRRPYRVILACPASPTFPGDTEAEVFTEVFVIRADGSRTRVLQKPGVNAIEADWSVGLMTGLFFESRITTARSLPANYSDWGDRSIGIDLSSITAYGSGSPSQGSVEVNRQLGLTLTSRQFA